MYNHLELEVKKQIKQERNAIKKCCASESRRELVLYMLNVAGILETATQRGAFRKLRINNAVTSGETLTTKKRIHSQHMK